MDGSPNPPKRLTRESIREVERRVDWLRSQFSAGAISKEELKAKLREMTLLDSQGRWWTLGLESDQWYVSEQRKWVKADPFQALPALPEPPAQPATATAEVRAEPAPALPRGRAEEVDQGAALKPPPVKDPEATVVASAAYDFSSKPQATAPGASYSARTQPAAGASPPGAGGFAVGSGGFVYIPPREPAAEAKAAPAPARNVLLRAAIIIGGLVLLCLLVFFAAIVFTYFSVVAQYRDDIDNLPQLVLSFNSSVVYDATGQSIGEVVPAEGRRLPMPLDRISPYMIHATVATENERFFQDPGYDWIAIIRALTQNLLAGDVASGASTITQQVVRATIIDPSQRAEITAWRKVQEVILAAEVSRQYSKSQILGWYLNHVYYGNLAYGVEAAAQTYFDKSASELNLSEAALLAGIPQAPARYDPVRNREEVIKRMNTVLELMARANGNGCIQFEHGNWLQAGPFCVSRADWTAGQGVLDKALVETRIFEPPQVDTRYPHFLLYVREWLEKNLTDVHIDGLKVYTTFDPRIQDIAQDAVNRHLAALPNVTNAAVVVIRPQDGAILAMVGSANFYNEAISGQINMATRPRQTGSAIKPVTYLAGFEALGWTPATVFWDVPTTYPNYTPRNFDGEFHGPQPLRYALGNSYNIPAVKAYAQVGWDRFANMAQRLGITLQGDQSNTGLSVGLGAREVTLLDMTAAYGVLANNGLRAGPYMVISVLDKDGREVYNRAQAPGPVQVTDPHYAYLMSHILSDPNARATEFGVGGPLVLPDGRPAAVKTGTTSDPERDAWTIGYTPDLVAGVWVGNADNTPIYGGTGSRAAAPIWNETLSRALATLGFAPKSFTPRDQNQIVSREICMDTGAQAWEACGNRIRSEIFFINNPPPPPDKDFFKLVEVDRTTGLRANEYCPNNKEKRLYIDLSIDPSAIQWLNADPAGQTWARDRGIVVPLQPVPAQSCGPDTRPATVVISAPVAGQTVSSVIEVRGSMSVPNFHRYQLEYAAGTIPPGVEAVAWSLAQGPFTIQPVGDAVLATWDTRGLPDGVYTIRILAIDQQGKQVDARVTVSVTNLTPTSPFTPTVTPSLTPSLTPGIIFTFTPTPTTIPTLTPTLTPTFTPSATLPPTFTPIPTFTSPPILTETPTWTPTATETPP